MATSENRLRSARECIEIERPLLRTRRSQLSRKLHPPRAAVLDGESPDCLRSDPRFQNHELLRVPPNLRLTSPRKEFTKEHFNPNEPVQVIQNTTTRQH